MLIVMCVVLAAAAAAPTPNCTLCLRERCYSPTDFHFNKYGLNSLQNADIDYNNNIIYKLRDWNYKINGTQLDNMTTFQIPVKEPYWPATTLAVDSTTGNVYYNYECLIYKYEPKSNKTTKVDFSCTHEEAPTHLWASNGTIYTESGNGLSYITDGSSIKIKGLEGIFIFNVVVDKTGNIYVQTMPKIYRVEKNVLATAFTASSTYSVPAMTLGGDGDVYLHDNGRIYHIHSETKELTKVGAFARGVSLWKFDKHNNIFVDNTNNLGPIEYFKRNSIRCRVFEKPYSSPEILTHETEAKTEDAGTAISNSSED